LSWFAVSPEQLLSASSTIDAGGGQDATLPSASLAGAAASTPIAAAWTAFLEDAIGASAALDEVYVELSAALRAAGRNYQRSETQATDGFEGGRPR
jgi:hypothetical protein